MVISVWRAGGLLGSLAFIERQNEGMKGHVAAHSDAVGFSLLVLSNDVTSPYRLCEFSIVTHVFAKVVRGVVCVAVVSVEVAVCESESVGGFTVGVYGCCDIVLILVVGVDGV